MYTLSDYPTPDRMLKTALPIVVVLFFLPEDNDENADDLAAIKQQRKPVMDVRLSYLSCAKFVMLMGSENYHSSLLIL